jgi:hypothetical protein
MVVSEVRRGCRIIAIYLVCQTAPFLRHHQSLIAPLK